MELMIVKEIRTWKLCWSGQGDVLKMPSDAASRPDSCWLRACVAWVVHFVPANQTYLRVGEQNFFCPHRTDIRFVLLHTVESTHIIEFRHSATRGFPVRHDRSGVPSRRHCLPGHSNLRHQQASKFASNTTSPLSAQSTPVSTLLHPPRFLAATLTHTTLRTLAAAMAPSKWGTSLTLHESLPPHFLPKARPVDGSANRFDRRRRRRLDAALIPAARCT